MHKLVSRACQNILLEVLLHFPTIIAETAHYIFLDKGGMVEYDCVYHREMIMDDSRIQQPLGTGLMLQNKNYRIPKLKHLSNNVHFR